MLDKQNTFNAKKLPLLIINLLFVAEQIDVKRGKIMFGVGKVLGTTILIAGTAAIVTVRWLRAKLEKTEMLPKYCLLHKTGYDGKIGPT